MPWSLFFKYLVLSWLLHSPLSFTLIKKLFSSSSLPAISVVSSAYLSLLMFLPSILIPACNSCSLPFLMMCLAYQLTKQGDSRQPCRTPFSTMNQWVVPYRVLTVVCWPSYSFLRRQVRWSGIPISLRAFQSVVIHTVKGFTIVNVTEVDVFSGISLLSLWSSICWELNLWFLCLS